MNRMAEDFFCAARLPAPALATLADLRRESGIGVIADGQHAWIRWEAGDRRLALRLMAIPGAELFALRDGLWYPAGGRLPRFGLPLDAAEAISLHVAVTPRPVHPEAPGPTAPRPTALGLARDDRARPASALLCPLADLGRWADTATTAQIESLSAALCGDCAILRGRALPPIAQAERFWGRSVLTPLGFRPDPNLSERAILGALRVGEDELLLLNPDAFELVPRDALAPLTRASVRLAIAGRSP
jgi:hypothetical protein